MKRLFPILAAAAFLCSAGCANRGNPEKAQTESDVNSEDTASPSGWYYFSDTGIHPAQNPAGIPSRTFVPWTEAVRVADTAIVDGSPSFLINRLGLMSAGSDGTMPALHMDATLFSSATAAGIYNTGTETGIRLYRNSFFTGTGKNDDRPGDSTCMARFDDGVFTESLGPADFGLPPEAQCVALDRIGSMWYAAFKYEQNGKVQFSYIEFESFPLRTDSPGNGGISGGIKMSPEAYRKSVAPFSFKEAPERLVSLLTGIPETTGLNLRVYAPDSRSTQSYVRTGEGTAVDGTAFISDLQTAALFSDGTFYIRSGDSGGRTQVLQLPSLSNGYVYTSFVLAGKKLLVSWEEQRFFETGRAGLLEIVIPDAIY